MSGISKRTFLKAAAAAGGLSFLNCSFAAAAQTASGSQEPATVYFLKDLSTDSLIKAFDAVKAPLTGKIAVKLHTGEPNGPNILPRPWVQKLIEHIPNSTIVETNVLYGSPRQTTEGHRQTLKTNGWTFAPVDILDEDGDINWPIAGGKHLKEVAVGHIWRTTTPCSYSLTLRGTQWRVSADRLKTSPSAAPPAATANARFIAIGTRVVSFLNEWLKAAKRSPIISEKKLSTLTCFAACPLTVTVPVHLLQNLRYRIWAFSPQPTFWQSIRQVLTWSGHCPKSKSMTWLSVSNLGKDCTS